jgi:rsbT co-antagonist protein RsbR
MAEPTENELRRRIDELERQLAEQARAAEEQARLLSEARRLKEQRDALIACLPGVVWEVERIPDPPFLRLVFISDKVKPIFGYTDNEWISNPDFWVTLIHPEDREEMARRVVERLMEGGDHVFACRMVAKDGRIIHGEIHATVLLDEAGEPVGMRGVMLDVTEQQLAEQETQRFVAAIETSDDFIGLATMEGKGLYVNEAGQRMVGLDGIESVRRVSVVDFFAPEDLAFVEEQILPTMMRDGRWRGEYRFRHFKTGALIPVYYNAFTIKDRSTGQLIGMATVTRDITERKRAEEERAAHQEAIIRAQAAALRELSTPLIPISERVVVMPLIGIVDSMRAQQIMETLLQGVSAQGSEIAIIDITGVPVVDTQVGSALMSAAKAVKLLGAQVLITGVRPEVAQTIVTLGIDLRGIITRSDLQSGIAFAMQRGRGAGARGDPLEGAAGRQGA